MQEPAKKLCQICRKEEPADGRQICHICMGLERPKEDFKYHCEIHGPHNGGMVGGRHTHTCPTCIMDKRRASISKSLRERNALIRKAKNKPAENNSIYPTIVLDFKDCPLLLEWIELASHSRNVDPATFVLELLLDQVPGEELLKIMRDKILRKEVVPMGE